MYKRQGKGLPAAENDPTSYHGIKGKVGYEPETQAPSYTKVYGKLITDLGRKNDKVLTITAAMCDGTGLNEFRDTFPSRYFDVGIAEGHAVTFAAGLAAKGFRPVVSIYSTFLQRAIDSIIHDVSLQHLPVIFAIDRGGLVGEDGPTHHGIFDLSYLSMIPDVVLSAPKDGNELRDLLHTALTVIDKPFFIRYPRDHSVRFDENANPKILPIGSWEILQEGKKLAVIATGAMIGEAEQALELLKADGISPTLVNARFIKPLDTKILEKLADEHKTVLIIEENVPTGGLASAVMWHLQQNNIKVKIATMSLPDGYVTHGARVQILEDAGLSYRAIAKKIRKILNKE